MSHVEIHCPHCGATGRVDNDTQSPFMMGRCPVCSGYVVYFCGASLALDEDMIDSHSLVTVRDHILARIDEFLEERLTEFLEEYADEFHIASISAAPQEQELTFEPVSQPEFPSAVSAPSTPSAEAVQPAITDAEVEDFLRIDLNLIDRSWYFEKHFGSTQGNR